jgi:hypothetical protein
MYDPRALVIVREAGSKLAPADFWLERSLSIELRRLDSGIPVDNGRGVKIEAAEACLLAWL